MGVLQGTKELKSSLLVDDIVTVCLGIAMTNGGGEPIFATGEYIFIVLL